jgi:hypothetical protein
MPKGSDWNLGELSYWLSETYKQKGAGWFIWRLGAVLLLLWFVLPGEADPVPVQTPEAETPVAPIVLDNSITYEPTKTDLRKIMSTTQTKLYWDSFNWMMEYGQPKQARDFNHPILKLRYVMSDMLDSAPKGKCRAFRERLIIGERGNQHAGIACQQAKADWCKQIQGEKMQCRNKAPKGMDAWTNRHFDTHNLNIKLNNTLAKLPSF